ncbi:MAG: HTH domain-containing protein [Actinomycetota bacterium]
MEPLDAAVAVLREAGEPLHWTVIQDRALRQGLIDPFVVTDVRATLLGALRDGVRARTLVRAGTGVYELAEPAEGRKETRTVDETETEV